MSDGNAPYHAHIYYSEGDRPAASALRDEFAARAGILFVGAMTDRGVGPHPIPQYEVHFRESSLDNVVAAIEAPDECVLEDLLRERPVADAPLHEREELAVVRDQLIDDRLGQGLDRIF